LAMTASSTPVGLKGDISASEASKMDSCWLIPAPPPLSLDKCCITAHASSSAFARRHCERTTGLTKFSASTGQ
jgi:hypothetical protein